uniref:Endonuclease/exonuclease/phosphatase domain-containing protein n=1 Tax=Brassica oleracea TaxID=3712 RepID=A0A3P6DRA5_BRAOL|nr:unnamed protein product [Brassica oleracea]
MDDAPGPLPPDFILALPAPHTSRPIIPTLPSSTSKLVTPVTSTSFNPFIPTSTPVPNLISPNHLPEQSPPSSFSAIPTSNLFLPLSLEASSTPSTSGPSEGRPPYVIMSIKTFFWNVHGLNDPDKHHLFTSWLSSNQPVAGAILESHIKEPNLNLVMQRACKGWSYFANHDTDDDGRIIVIWKYPATVQILHQSRQSITCSVAVPGSTTFHLSAVYASNLRDERLRLWEDLKEVQTTLFLETRNWIMADLRYQGSCYTWTNSSPSNPTTKKLDRALVNCQWLQSYPNSVASFLPFEFSDHSPCLIDLSCPLPSSGTKPFKFFNFLTTLLLWTRLKRLGFNVETGQRTSVC